jgi:hypothetical protein
MQNNAPGNFKIHFSSGHVTFIQADHMLSQKTGLHKFQNSELIQSIFSGDNETKLHINNKKIMNQVFIIMVAHTYNPSYFTWEIRRLEI